jgi:ferredoxin
MDRVMSLWEREGASARLRHERFALAPTPPPVAPGSPTGARVTLTRSGRTVPVSGSGTLLAELEGAGERPAYGCRMGICQTCKCRKQSGTVQNLRTGSVSSAPDEDIQLCISVARSDIELGL